MEKKNGEREGGKYINFCRGKYCCDLRVLHERGRKDVRKNWTKYCSAWETALSKVRRA